MELKATSLVDHYNFEDQALLVAEQRGLVMILPKENELQIDIDSCEQYNEFQRRLSCFNFDPVPEVVTKYSVSGYPHMHITLTFKDITFTAERRILLQAALNDDPLRVFLSTRRLLFGIENPTTLFELPTQ